MKRSLLELLLVLGILTFFLLPFFQLWTIETSPWLDADTQRRAAVLAENLLEDALARPCPNPPLPPQYVTLPAETGGSSEYEGQVETFAHPEHDGLTVYRATVRWGVFPWHKSVVLETVRSRFAP